MKARLLDDTALPGAFNMAVDEQLALTAGTNRIVTLRFYGWKRPTLSLGRHERVDGLPFERLRAAGIDVVRRPTGGRAVLHHLELTYSFAAPVELFGRARGLAETYGQVSEALRQGLALVGCELEAGTEKPDLATHMCFALKAGCDLQHQGRKVAGSALRRYRDSILQHGALPLKLDARLQAAVFQQEGETFDAFSARLFAAVCPLEELLPTGLDLASLKAALREGFQQQFGFDFTPAELEAREKRTACNRAFEFVI